MRADFLPLPARVFRALAAGLSVLLICSSCARPGAVDPRPVTSSFGPFELKTFQQYETLALFAFADAPSAPGTGQQVATVLSGLLEPMGYTVLNQAELDQLAQKELQLSPGEPRPQSALISIAKLGGAQALVTGEVGEWVKTSKLGPVVWVPLTPGITRLPRKEWNETSLALAVKIVDVRSGETVFTGQGTLSAPTRDHPKIGIEEILLSLLSRCFSHIAPTRSGLLGYKTEWQTFQGRRVPVVREIISSSGAQRAGLRIGDVILNCGEEPATAWKTVWQHRNACGADAGQTKVIQVLRDGHPLTVRVTAQTRDTEPPPVEDGRTITDLYAPL